MAVSHRHLVWLVVNGFHYGNERDVKVLGVSLKERYSWEALFFFFYSSQ